MVLTPVLIRWVEVILFFKRLATRCSAHQAQTSASGRRVLTCCFFLSAAPRPSGASRTSRTPPGSCYINPTTTSLSCSSDARLKTNITTLSDLSGLDALLQLNPVTFNWIHEATGTPPHSGFIAQDVQKVMPDLISQGPDGYFTMNYAGLVTYIVKAIQQLAAQLSDLANTVAAFADHFSTKELTFTRATGDEIDVKRTTTDTLCVRDTAGATCITRAQLDALLQQTGQSAASPPSAPSSGGSPSTSDASSSAPALPSAPPVIQSNGENPAHIHVGDTYNDLGATITGPQADLNLGIKTFLNGALVSNIVLDTSTTSTDTIDYVVTDTNGLTFTSTRTVIIEATSAELPSPSPATSTATI